MRPRNEVILLIGWDDPLSGGIYTATKRLALALRDHGVQVTVFGLKVRSDSHHESWISDSFMIVGPRGFGFSLGMLYATLRYRHSIIHLHGLFSFQSLLALMMKVIFNTQIIISPHGMSGNFEFSGLRYFKKIWWYLVDLPLLRIADSVHVLCDEEHQTVSSILRDRYTCSNIPNLCDTPPRVKSGVFTLKSQITLVFLGRIHPKKNLESLLKALSLTTGETKRKITLKIFGWKTKELVQLQQAFSGLFEAGVVKFSGPITSDEKFDVLCDADFQILPSHSEGLPMSIIEGFSCGLPALVSQFCNLGDAVRSGCAIDCGVTPEHIKHCLKRIDSMSDNEYRLLIEQAKIFSKKFKSKNLITAYCELYEN